MVCGLRFAVCVKDEVEDRFVVAHDKTNGWWELWNSKRQWVGGHGTFDAPDVGLLWTQAPFFILSLQSNLKFTKPITQY
jgi:hypothetical protein